MGRLDDADWWWTTALDGVVGAILAGLVTLAVLAISLRWQSNAAKSQAFQAECSRVLGLTRELSRQLMFNRASYLSSQFEWQGEINALIWRAADDACFVAILEAISRAVGEHSAGGYSPAEGLEIRDSQNAVTAIQNAIGALSARLAIPNHFRRMTESRCRETVESIQANWVVF